VPDTFPAQLVRAAIPFNAHVIIDTSGKALRRLATTPADPPYLLRMDKAEAESLARSPLETVTELGSFARALVSKKIAENVVLALGPLGSVLATPSQCWHAAAADVPVRSKVGAGDSFVGAMTLALAHGDRCEIALQKGVAAASAAVTTDATRLCPRAIAESLIRDCPLHRLQ
jgi:6-phosphofructokinase 2